VKKIEIHLTAEYDGEVTDAEVIGLEREVERHVGDGLLELPEQVPSGWRVTVAEKEEPPARFFLNIQTDNAAFHAEDCKCNAEECGEDCDDFNCDCTGATTANCESTKSHEIRRLLNDICQKLDDGYVAGFPYDFNGNKVGEWGFHAS